MEAKLNDKKQIKKEKGQCSSRWEQRKLEKGSIPQDEDKTKKKKTNTTKDRNGRIKKNLWQKRNVL